MMICTNPKLLTALLILVLCFGQLFSHKHAVIEYEDDGGVDDDGFNATSPDAEYRCKASAGDNSNKLNDFHWRGTNLGGWMVLEPWITPSLFYQFLGIDDPSRVALDSFTFCTALGKEEANRQLRKHWEAWVTKDHIKNLAAIGIDTVRIPVADWMFVPYEPFIGCWDGSLEMLDRVLDWCNEYNIKVLIDVHTMIGSQNPFDNSGRANEIIWLTSNHYVHTDNSDFMGLYEENNKTNATVLEYFCEDHVIHALEVAQAIVTRYKANPAVIALEPVNEPWDATPLHLLKSFYFKVYKLVQKQAPHWVTVFHDSFRFSTTFWGDFLHDCPNFAIDTHIYQAWSDNEPEQVYQSTVCNNALNIRKMERAGVPVVVGEWSLATDNCAQWLNGFNDNLVGYPKVECTRIPCPVSYLQNFDYEYQYKDQQEQQQQQKQLLNANSSSLSSTDSEKDEMEFFLSTLGMIPAEVRSNSKYETEPVGPFGSGGESYIINGTCVKDGSFSVNSSLNDYIIQQIGFSMLSAYDADSHGQFFWNFRTELEERWSYQQAVALGWLPTYRQGEGNGQSPSKAAPTKAVAKSGVWKPETGEVALACTVQGKLPLYNHTYDLLVTEEEAESLADDRYTHAYRHTHRHGHWVWVVRTFLLVVAVLCGIYCAPTLWRRVRYGGWTSDEVELPTRNPNFRYEPIPDTE